MPYLTTPAHLTALLCPPTQKENLNKRHAFSPSNHVEECTQQEHIDLCQNDTFPECFSI